MTEEQRLIDQTTREFVKAEVLERNDELEAKDWDLARRLLQRCGELGILGTDVPEQYGGFPLDTVTTAVIAGRFGEAGSFSTTFGAQTGLAILPILAFGTEAQKQRYLPKLVSGERVGGLLSQRSGVRFGRAGRQDARRPPAGRQLPAQRREDVDLQRRLRGRLYRVREGGR